MFPVFSIQRVKELIEGAGKQREVWEVFVPKASGFDETPNTFNEIKVGGNRLEGKGAPCRARLPFP